MIAMFTSVSVFGEWAAKTEAAGNGTGAGLRAKLARGLPIRTEKRPDGVKSFGRMKNNITLTAMKFHIHSRTAPGEGLRFF